MTCSAIEGTFQILPQRLEIYTASSPAFPYCNRIAELGIQVVK